MIKESVKSKVALVKGSDRRQNILRALRLIVDEVDLRDKRRIVIKPNFLSTTRQLASTHVDAVRGVLDFLQDYTVEKITIAEAAGPSKTAEGFNNFGYNKLADEYRIELLDLDDDATVEVQIYNTKLQPIPIRISRRIVESDYRISVCPLKTHDCVVATLALKNVLMGSVARKYRSSIHQDQEYAVMNINLFKLAQKVHPHLAVLDGLEGMEGDGPGNGDAVHLGVAVASTDVIAADSVAARIMGFDPDKIGYLHYCKLNRIGKGDLDQIEILGCRLEDCLHPFKPHPLYQQQLNWHIPNAERFF